MGGATVSATGEVKTWNHGEAWLPINPDGPEAATLIESQAQQIATMREALKPFSAIKPSTFYPQDGSEAEPYLVILKGSSRDTPDFTGADLARARDAIRSLSPGEKG